MDHEGILIEVDQGRVTRVFTNGVPLSGGAAVTYDGADTELLPVREPTHQEQIERIAAALIEGRNNTQRRGIRTACETAANHYQAIARATGALANLLADTTRNGIEDPATLVTRIQEAVNRIDDDILREIRQQLLVTCAGAMELRFGVPEEDEYVPPRRTPATDTGNADAAPYGSQELPPELPADLPRVASYPR